MDARLKNYADAMYDQSLMKSVAESSDARVAFLRERAARNPAAYIPLGGADVQALAKLFGEHIERCMASRLASYHKAFDEAGRTPTEEEFTETLNEVKVVRGREVANSAAALSRLASSQGAANIGNVRSLLEPLSAHAHDRVLRDWKIWGEQTRLKTSKQEKTLVEKNPKPDKSALYWLLENLWRWEVVAIGATSIYAAGIAAMYGDDYPVAAGLYVVGISWLTVKSYTWEETKAHKKKGRVRSLILAGSLVVLAASVSWIAHRERLHQAELIRTPQPTASIPTTAQPQAREELPARPKPPGVDSNSDKPEVTPPEKVYAGQEVPVVCGSPGWVRSNSRVYWPFTPINLWVEGITFKQDATLLHVAVSPWSDSRDGASLQQATDAYLTDDHGSRYDLKEDKGEYFPNRQGSPDTRPVKADEVYRFDLLFGRIRPTDSLIFHHPQFEPISLRFPWSRLPAPAQGAGGGPSSGVALPERGAAESEKDNPNRPCPVGTTKTATSYGSYCADNPAPGRVPKLTDGRVEWDCGVTAVLDFAAV